MKNIGLILTGMALMLTLVLGWSWYQSDATASNPPFVEIWATYGTPDWDEFEETMNYAGNKGYRLGGYSVTRNSKGTLIKFAVLEKR